MKITTITYRRTLQLVSETEEFLVTASVESDDDPVSSAEKLRSWVEERLGVRNSAIQAERDRNNFETERRRIEKRIDEAKEKWARIQKFFNKLEISPEINVDDIPF